jgi:hypothetical protein
LGKTRKAEISDFPYQISHHQPSAPFENRPSRAFLIPLSIQTCKNERRRF